MHRNRRTFIHLICHLFFVVLVLAVSAERRLVELRFDWSGTERIENDEEPDGDEILNRLVFVDDTALPTVPLVAGASVAGLPPAAPCSRSLFVGRPSNPRAPPPLLLSRVA